MRKSATESVVEALRTAILVGRAGPGDRLAETALVAQLDVSRNTVREAFRVLEHEGLVEHLPNRGVFVRRPSPGEARDVYRTRRILECGALRDAAVRRAERVTLGADERAAFEQAWDATVAGVRAAVADGLAAREAGDWEALGTANGEFHLALARLADNPTIDQLLRGLLIEMRLLFVTVAAAQDVHERYLADNERVLALVEAGDLLRAAVALEDYLLRAEQHLVGRYAEQVSTAETLV
jgi:DNA-binding GntR family transcriptional regulator